MVAVPESRVAVLSRVRFGHGDPTTALVDGCLWLADITAQGPATVAIDTVGGATAWGPGAEELLARVPGIRGDLDDPAGFVAHHPAVALAARRHGVPRLSRTSSVLPALVQAVLGQRVTVVEARRSWQALVHRYGAAAPGPREGLRVPPTAEVLAGLRYFAFHPMGVERRRAEIISRAARYARRLQAQVVGSPADAESVLRALPGIGPWTSATVRLAVLGDPDVVLLGDLHAPHVVAWALAGRRRGTDDEMVELLEPYRGHRARVVRLLMHAGLGPPRRAPHQRIEPIANR